MIVPRSVQFGFGVALLVTGGILAMSPLVVAEALGRPHETAPQMINLRASWGGPLIGLGAFVAWLPALRPWLRTVLGLILWAMAGIALARTLGFVLDGSPDGRQWLWLSLEIALVLGAAYALRRQRTAKSA